MRYLTPRLYKIIEYACGPELPYFHSLYAATRREEAIFRPLHRITSRRRLISRAKHPRDFFWTFREGYFCLLLSSHAFTALFHAYIHDNAFSRLFISFIDEQQKQRRVLTRSRHAALRCRTDYRIAP